MLEGGSNRSISLSPFVPDELAVLPVDMVRNTYFWDPNCRIAPLRTPWISNQFSEAWWQRGPGRSLTSNHDHLRQGTCAHGGVHHPCGASKTSFLGIPIAMWIHRWLFSCSHRQFLILTVRTSTPFNTKITGSLASIVLNFSTRLLGNSTVSLALWVSVVFSKWTGCSGPKICLNSAFNCENTIWSSPSTVSFFLREECLTKENTIRVSFILRRFSSIIHAT